MFEVSPLSNLEPDIYSRKWTKNEVTTKVLLNNQPEGPVLDMFPDSSATEIFMTLFEGILEQLVHQTNLYATQKNITLNLKPYELLNFIGINFFMGYHKVPGWKNYWS